MRPHGRAHYVRHRYSVSCPVLSLSPSLPSLVVLSRHLSLSRSSPFFPPPPSFTPSLRFPVLRFPSSLFVSPSRSAVSPVGADTLTFPHHPEERSIPHQSEARSRAPVVGPATTSCVYPTLSLPTSVCAPAACSPLQHIGWNTHARNTHTAATAAAAAAASRANTLLSRKIKANTTGERDAGHLAEAFSTGSTLACEFFSRGVDRGEGEDGFFDGILDPFGWGRVWDSSGRWRCEYGEGE